jgi:hypothetical protein
MDAPKRNAPVQVALTSDDLKLIDAHRESRPFTISRSEFGCVAIRFMLDSLRRGQWSLESLFQNYLKHPLQPLSGIELAQAAQLVILREACIGATGKSVDEADRIALLLGYRSLEAFEWVAPEAEQESERLSA